MSYDSIEITSGFCSRGCNSDATSIAQIISAAFNCLIETFFESSVLTNFKISCSFSNS
jgi:hypothetical protein